ncbi:MAG: serine/threonine protein kinase, partial [Burkholderiales bacterium]
MAELTVKRIGKYEILEKLEEGATSTVYLAKDDFNSRQVAIKLVSQSALNDEARGKLMHNLFLTEASLAG